MKKVLLLLAFIALLATFAILPGMAQYVGLGTPAPAPAVPNVITGPGVPPEVSQYSTDWPLPNRDYNGTRATMDAQINSENVNNLGVAWVMNMEPGLSNFGSASCTPIIMGDNVYFQDLDNNFYKINRVTGDLIWSRMFNVYNLGPNGPAVGYGMVYGSTGPFTLGALSAGSGTLMWETPLSSINTGTVGIDIQPTVYNNKVYTSTVPGSNLANFYGGGGIGYLYALDARSGAEVWNFSTVAPPPADLWGNPTYNSGGGAWFPPSVDLKTGLTFWGTGNPGPWPGYDPYPNGESRPGPNLYTNTLLALNNSDGNMSWYNQVWPHGLTDYDLQQSPILISSEWNGVPQEMILASGKMGRVYAFNRTTGALLWVVNVGKHQNDTWEAFPTNGTIEVFPGPTGGVETPLAYANGIVYAAANNLGATFINGTNDTLHSFGTATGDVVAIRTNLGKIVWDQTFDSANYGGATVVNDLVFSGAFDGMIRAYNATTGELVWSYQAPAGINAWPAAAKDTLIWPVAGPGGAPVLMAFQLGATTPVVNIVSPVPGAVLPAGNITVDTQVFNFQLVDKLGNASVPGEGHLHYFLDVPAPDVPDQLAIPPPGSIWAATPDTSYTFQNVSPGFHTVYVEAVNNNHTALNPPVVQKISFHTTSAPLVDIIGPKNGEVLLAGKVTIDVKVDNFKLVAPSGQPNAPNEGHLVYYQNAAVPTTPGQPALTPGGTSVASSGTSYTFSSVAPGDPVKMAVQLVNNDNTPLNPPVYEEISTIVFQYTGIGGEGTQ